ncbi:tRNA (guanosine(46)-N7)-methyltransferase TrmB [Thiohalocapsa marina]|uniref:tRNA (guanosine(46)-N7)-methyltransferase TrmB n=1 Tax=Thiohalocapsa marina TaxID=424902 RepID=UPI001FE5A738|nr:tRNA (guanosine(46)-N7)-methyltransferase TrmB [Thiohalocapsa marina]
MSAACKESEIDAPPRRPVRSFVLREGRLTTGQARAFSELWPRFGVDRRPEQPLDLPALFGNGNPCVLEIGFGNGESLAKMAQSQPGRNFLGLEVHRPGVGHLLLEIERRELDNLRVMRADALELLRDGLAPGSLAAVQLFFPDPWPKKRHHKRRIVQPAFLRLVARALASGGTFHAATDWEPYAEHMLATLEAADTLFRNAAGRGRFSPRPPERPQTKFERRGEGLGHRVHDLIYIRR